MFANKRSARENLNLTEWKRKNVKPTEAVPIKDFFSTDDAGQAAKMFSQENVENLPQDLSLLVSVNCYHVI